MKLKFRKHFKAVTVFAGMVLSEHPINRSGDNLKAIRRRVEYYSALPPDSKLITVFQRQCTGLSRMHSSGSACTSYLPRLQVRAIRIQLAAWVAGAGKSWNLTEFLRQRGTYAVALLPVFRQMFFTACEDV